MPLLAVSDHFFSPIWSTYHQDLLTFDRTAQRLISWQHFTFLPLLMVAKFGEQTNLHRAAPPGMWWEDHLCCKPTFSSVAEPAKSSLAQMCCFGFII